MGQGGAVQRGVLGHRGHGSEEGAGRVRPIQPASVTGRRQCCERGAAAAQEARAPSGCGATSHMPTATTIAMPAHGDDPVQQRHLRVDPGLHRRVVGGNFAGEIAQQSAARDDEPRKALHELHHELRPENDDGNADHQSEDQQHQASLRRRRNANHVVEAHHQVGHDHRPDGGQQAVACLDVRLAAIVLGNQLDADPEQQRGADELKERELQELDGEKRQHDPQDDRAHHAPEDPEHAHPAREIAARERDHHRVVAGEQDVDDDDLERPRPRTGASRIPTR